MIYDPHKDPRFGKPGWTLIYPTDGHPYFVQAVQRKRRASPRAVRFGLLKVGHCMIHRQTFKQEITDPPTRETFLLANDNRRVEVKTSVGLAVCEARWFDPVAGEKNATAGEMAAVRAITPRGFAPSLWRHTLRGLATNGYHPLLPDQSDTILKWVTEMDLLIHHVDVGEMTADEARAVHRPWRMLMTELGVVE